MQKTIIYDSRSFTLGTKKRYYFATVLGKTTSLHRYKYEKETGPIPPGWHVHHKDRNCFNNDIDNLEAINPEQHSKLHPPSAENMIKWQKSGIKSASVWHGSSKGIDWHKSHYEKIKNKIHQRRGRNCDNCGAYIQTTRKAGHCFCGNNCKSAWRRKNKPDMKHFVCPTCGKSFITRKYLPAVYCSKQCKPAPNPLGYHARNK
jgi:hypothetical protein